MYLTPIPTRHAFARESDLEASIVSQLESEDSELAALLGLEVTDVATQRSNGNLRPDITVNSNSETGEAEAIIELTLEPLDRDHV